MVTKSKLHYFFVWGRHPALACAEVLSALERWKIKAELVDASIESGIIRVNQYLPDEFIDQLGGTIKLGLVVDSFPSKEKNKKIIAEKIAVQISHAQVGKLVFGISQYRAHNLTKNLPHRMFTSIGMEVKTILKKHQNVRWVTSREPNLSSVVVKKNKLIEKGGELVLLHTPKETLVGRTTAIQPFEEYSIRDYGRLEIDSVSGMLPPKLAHIMLNISRMNPDDVIVDPFCGSGTILQEALVMGWHHVVGADNSEKAINATKKNTLWAINKYELTNSIVRVFHSDVKTLSEHFRGSAIDAIITEPYLGPPLKKRVNKKTAEKILQELEALYLLAFIDFRNYLKKGGRVVMVWPVYILGSAKGGLKHINLISKLKKYGYKLSEPYQKNIAEYNLGAMTAHGTYIYGRPKQKIWREIVVFEYTGKAS